VQSMMLIVSVNICFIRQKCKKEEKDKSCNLSCPKVRTPLPKRRTNKWKHQMPPTAKPSAGLVFSDLIRYKVCEYVEPRDLSL